MKKRPGIGRILTPEEMRAAQEFKDKIVRQWAAENNVGTKPSTFPEKKRGK
jgi:hypothetical protein